MALTRRNAPLTAAQKRALKAILLAHRNPGKKRKTRKSKARKASRRGKLTKAQRRLISLRNLRKARAALRTKTRRKYGTTSRRTIRSTAAFNRRQRRAFKRIDRHGYKARRSTRSRRLDAAFAARARGEDSGDYSAYTLDNPRRVTRRGGKRYVTITRKDGKGIRTVRRGKVVRIKALRFRIKSRKGKVPARLRKFLFKAGTPRLKKMLTKARAGYKAWRRRQIARR